MSKKERLIKLVEKEMELRARGDINLRKRILEVMNKAMYLKEENIPDEDGSCSLTDAARGFVDFCLINNFQLEWVEYEDDLIFN